MCSIYNYIHVCMYVYTFDFNYYEQLKKPKGFHFPHYLFHAYTMSTDNLWYGHHLGDHDSYLVF